MTRLFVLVFLLTACGSSADESNEKDSIKLITEAELADRLVVKDEEVPILALPEESSLHAANLALQLRLIGEVDAPEIDGTTVQATDVIIDSRYAFVSYNVQGETQRGALDAIDIAQLSNPRLVSELQFGERDVNAVARRRNQLYITGATQDGGAYVATMSHSRGSLSDDVSFDEDLPSFAGTDVDVDRNTLWVTSGDAGGIYSYATNGFNRTGSVEISDARAVDTSGGTVATLSGGPATIRLLDDSAIEETFEIGGANTPESKSTIQLGGRWAAASVGEEGWKIICLADGETIHHEPAVEVSGLPPEKTVTNAVSVSGSLLYAANGEAGVYVYRLRNTGGNSCRRLSVEALGYISLGEGLSANHVMARFSAVFVADGLGGLKILRRSGGFTDDDIDDFDDDDDDEDEDNNDDND